MKKSCRISIEELDCYCNAPSPRTKNMLQCRKCKRWFHDTCIQCLELPILLSDPFFVFVCGVCNSGSEYLGRMELKWVDIVHLFLYHLSVIHDKRYFDIDKEILPFMNEHWQNSCLIGQISKTLKKNRKECVLSALYNHRKRFKSSKDIRSDPTSWGLKTISPPSAPDVMIMGVQSRRHGNKWDMKIPQRKYEIIHSNPLYVRGDSETKQRPSEKIPYEKQISSEKKSSEKQLSEKKSSEKQLSEKKSYEKQLSEKKSSEKQLLERKSSEKRLSEKRESIELQNEKPKCQNHDIQNGNKKRPPNAKTKKGRPPKDDDVTIISSLDTLIPHPPSFDKSHNPFKRSGKKRKLMERSHIAPSKVKKTNNRNENTAHMASELSIEELRSSKINNILNGSRLPFNATNHQNGNDSRRTRHSVQNELELKADLFHNQTEGLEKEAFSIVGRRVDCNGQIQFLVQWN